MFSRIPGWSLGASVRLYSTSSAPKGNSTGFLSDLMKRIDTINMKTDEISKKRAKQSEAERRLAVINHKTNQIDKSQSQAQVEARAKKVREQKKAGIVPPKPAKQATRAKIAVADHPLSSNMFKLMDAKNFGNAARSAPGQNANSARNARPGNGNGSGNVNANGNNRNTRGTRSARSFGERPAGRSAGRPAGRATGRATGDRKFKLPTAKASRATVASIVPKKLQAAALRPTLGANTFLYGKPARLGVSTSSRVAAVAKEFLLKSNYPYKLPRSIIDGMDARFSGNRFLLQRDFNTRVNAKQFSGRIRRVVRGETDDIKAKAGASDAEKEAHRGLIENGSLSLAQKQTIYDVVTGAKSASSLTVGAAWTK